MADNIGSAWISIGATGQAQFAAQARALVDSATKSLKPDVTIGVQLGPSVAAKMAALKATTATLQTGLNGLRANVQTASATAAVAALQARAYALSNILSKANPGSLDQTLGSESKVLALAAATEKLAQAQEDAGKQPMTVVLTTAYGAQLSRSFRVPSLSMVALSTGWHRSSRPKLADGTSSPRASLRR